MLSGLKSTFERTAPMLLEDAVGCLSLVVLLLVGLHIAALV